MLRPSWISRWASGEKIPSRFILQLDILNYHKMKNKFGLTIISLPLFHAFWRPSWRLSWVSRGANRERSSISIYFATGDIKLPIHDNKWEILKDRFSQEHGEHILWKHFIPCGHFELFHEYITWKIVWTVKLRFLYTKMYI